MKVTYQQVKQKCSEGRFFSYTGFRDKSFAPISVFLVWVFLRLGVSGNAVSILSGLVAMAGGVLMASNDPVWVIIGSFGYMAFYLLDYVDGGVSRYNGKSGIGGQYVDWTMHVVTAVGVLSGIFAGAVGVAGTWVIPFGVLTIVAAALSLDRYALAWFAICMHYQQQRVKGTANDPLPVHRAIEKPSLFYRGLRYLISLCFHEDNAIFVFPALAVLNMFFGHLFDFRVALMLVGGLIYFPVVLFDIWRLAVNGHVDNAYNKLFFDKELPKLPGDHFFN